MAIKIGKSWEFNEAQFIKIFDREYNVHECLRKAVDLPVQEMRLDQMRIGWRSPTKDTFRSFLEHCKMVNDADTSFPILLNEDGELIDGKHRLGKALLEGHETIKYKRFETDPPSGYTEV